jgi:hypothetical protein
LFDTALESDEVSETYVRGKSTDIGTLTTVSNSKVDNGPHQAVYLSKLGRRQSNPDISRKGTLCVPSGLILTAPASANGTIGAHVL